MSLRRAALSGVPRTPRTPGDLASTTAALRVLSHGDEWRFAIPTASRSPPASGTLRTNSAEALRIAAIEGIGIFLAPSFLVTEDLGAGRVVPLLDGYKPVAFAINAIYPTRHQVTAKVRAFLDLAVERFQERREWIRQ
jgi:DNA-binding transcriptional LysR family regulator